MLVLLLLPLKLPKEILDSYLLLIAEKQYQETYKLDPRFNAPSVTRGEYNESADTHNCKNKKIP